MLQYSLYIAILTYFTAHLYLYNLIAYMNEVFLTAGKEKRHSCSPFSFRYFNRDDFSSSYNPINGISFIQIWTFQASKFQFQQIAPNYSFGWTRSSVLSHGVYRVG
mmetsp:Transcript_17449/g.27884  ORF Transcript_17449/g.27884 Transcript_17449/m.27884 type:complete len:106 (-) Transcript_17449:2178-2495(-)